MKQMKDLKKFSPEWWNNYWFYYKWHTIAAVFVLVLVIGTIIDVVTRVKPDIDITIASKYIYSEEQLSEIETKISDLIDDINNDGVKKVQLFSLNTTAQPGDEMQAAAREKLYLEFAAGDTFIFFMDKDLFDIYNDDDLFIELTSGQNFINAKEVFEFMSEDTIMCVRAQRFKEKADYTNTQKLLDTIINN